MFDIEENLKKLPDKTEFISIKTGWETLYMWERLFP